MSNKMLIISPERESKEKGGQKDEKLQEHHRKKIRNIINPVDFNSALNSEEVHFQNGNKK